MTEQRRYWIITSWKWWRYSHEHPFWVSVYLTYQTDIMRPIQNVYAWIENIAQTRIWFLDRKFKNNCRKLREIDEVKNRLAAFYTPDEIQQWLFLPHKLLNNEKPIVLIREGRTKEVLAVIEQLESLVYL